MLVHINIFHILTSKSKHYVLSDQTDDPQLQNWVTKDEFHKRHQKSSVPK